MAEGIDSPDAEGVGVAADRPEVAGVAEGVGIVMGNEGTVSVAGATRVGAAMDPQARLNAAIAERINIRMDGFVASFMDGFIVSISPSAAPIDWD